jgi:SAM-dependent methyltransferase
MFSPASSRGRSRLFGWAIALLGSWLLLTAPAIASVAADLAADLAAEPAPYSYRQPSADGIGKVYLGREIARVMGYPGAGWLERSSREREEAPDQAIAALDLAPDATVADLGAGTGYISFLLAARLPQGRVWAVEVQPDMLARLMQLEQERRDRGEPLAPIEPVLASPEDPHLPPNALDWAIAVDAYHEFAYPYEVMTQVVAALKPGGRIALVEYRAENPLVLIKRHHKMSQRQAQREMAAVGLQWRETLDLLPRQHLMIFEKPISATPAAP